MSQTPKIDILVYCHIYDNKYNGSGIQQQPPVFLFLYNEANNQYDKIELNKTNMDNIKREKNIHITFIDTSAKIDEYGYQKKDISQLEGIQFDYIFPINCPFFSAEEILNLLKPSGKYMYNNYNVDIINNEFFQRKYPPSEETNAVMANFRLKVIAESLKPRIQGTMIEFNKYRETHEPYVYKSDITTGAGWFIILTRNDLPNKVTPPLPAPPPLPPAPSTGGRNQNKNNNKMNKSNRRNKRTKKNRKLKMTKKNQRKTRK